ncbi:RING/U-box superfamily protein [Actinidia rufa]|uniref:E3 ubiquitin-protein ligase RMA n=1 Tax=Actinidia rufa TaxID=165716 RepID=A0A7J0EVK0_9ERIC|nr:RING/U-box superfamily protein [Actinidia rufa]
MMDNNMRDEEIMDLDLNQEPLDDPSNGPVLGLGSILNELETAHTRIEERIRQLEAVTARARQRQMWRQARNPPEANGGLIDVIGSIGSDGTAQNMGYSVASQEGADGRAKSCKRDSTHLVAKALELDTDVKKVVGDGGGFFDCNICLDMAREPILTCCGHLFCWACFYQLPYVYSAAKECPVCKGEVTDKNITPIYGNGNSMVDTHLSESEPGLKVPPRPQAHRIESFRQQRVNRGISHIPVAEALRRIRMGIGATGERPSYRTTLPSQGPTSEVGSSQGLRSDQFSRVLTENANSLLSISSALNNTERLFEDIESHIHNRILERSRGQVLSFGGGDPFTGSAALVQPEHQTVDSTAGITSVASSSERMQVSAFDVHLENLRRDAAAVINLTDSHPSPSSRRRIRLSRVLDGESGLFPEPRRRRLN